MTFPSIDAAVNYLKSKLQDFYGQSRVLRDRLLQIGALMQEAKKTNNQPALGQLLLLQNQTKQAMTEQLKLEQTLMPFANYFNINTSLGAIPIFIAMGAVGVAGLMYLHFEKIRNQGKALDLVAKGMLTPEQYQKSQEAGSFLGAGGLIGLTGNIGTILLYVIVGYGLLMVIPMIRKAS